MKKSFIIATVLATASAFATPTEFVSNPVALLQLSSIPATGNLKLVAMPFDGYAETAGSSVKVADVLLTDGLATNDKLYIPTGTKGQYNRYSLNASGEWVPANVVNVSGANITAGEGTPPNDAAVPRGGAFWLETAATSVKLLGQPAASMSKTSKSVSVGYQLLAPTTSEIDIKISDLAGAQKDLVILANGTRYQKTASGWKNVGTRKDVTDADVIPAGIGFWYKAASVGTTLSL